MSTYNHQQHECPKHQCTCSEVYDLTEVYQDLKCQRKRVSANNSEDGQRKKGVEQKQQQQCISPKELQMTRGQAEHVLGIVRTQREGVRNLMTALREFSQKLSKQEEMVCQTDKEIAELRDEMCRIKEYYDNKNQSSTTTDTINADEVTWRQSVDSEIHEQCKLKSKIKQLSECLDSRKQNECVIDTERQEERKIDAKLLLHAMDYVERCIHRDNET